MKNKMFITLICTILLLSGCAKNEIEKVKKGYLNECQDYTIEELVNNYMENPKWESETSDKGYYVYNVESKSNNDESSNILIQFGIDKDNIIVTDFEINEISQDSLTYSSLIKDMCSVTNEKYKEQQLSNMTDAQRFKQEYEELNSSSVNMQISEQNPIKYATINEIFDVLENKTGIVYFGFPGCPWCRNMLPVLLEFAKNNDIDTIYYLNPREVSDEEHSKLIDTLKDYLETNANGDLTLYVPDVYFVKDGKIIGHHLSTVSTQTDPYVPLTEEQKEELLKIFDDLFVKIGDNNE